MDFPTPDRPEMAPIWENYVAAQAASASLRLIPIDAWAMGVEVSGTRVTLVMQASSDSADDHEDLDDIVSELETLLGPEALVSKRLDVVEELRLRPDDAVRWFFAARA